MSIVLLGSTSGSCTLQEQAVAGTTTLTLPTFNGTVGLLVSGTAVASTSGTSIDFTGLPAGVRRITVMLRGVSTNGTSLVQVQLGDSGGVETTGYLGTARFAGGATAFSSGFLFDQSGSAAYVREAAYTLTNFSGNSWIGTCLTGLTNQTEVFYCAGSKVLSDVLDRVRITTVNGTDTFDAGSINILYE